MYNSVNQRQKRMIASENLKNIASKTKTLLEYSGYQPVSVDYLIESGVINNDKAPAGGPQWSVTSSYDGLEFSINLVGLTYEECAYFATKKLDWADHISINGYETATASFCMKTGDNQISFFVK